LLGAIDMPSVNLCNNYHIAGHSNQSFRPAYLLNTDSGFSSPFPLKSPFHHMLQFPPHARVVLVFNA
jgi:hypothetical protein